MADGDRWRLRPWTARGVLRAWERGDGAARGVRALAVLSTLLPESRRDELLHLPLGRRDTLLLEARIALVGPLLQGSARCPSCGAGQGFALEVADDLLSQAVALDAPRRASVRVGERTLELRAPTCADALAVEHLQPMAAWRELVRRCVTPEGDPPADAEEEVGLSTPELAAVGDRLEALDPLALVPLAMRCDDCGLDWQPLLDVAELVWAEVEDVARRLLDEIQTLAAAYGWSEEQILTMGGRRRRFYLERAPGRTGDDEAPRPQSPTTAWSPLA